MEQVFVDRQLAGRVTGYGKRQLLGSHPTAVVADSNHFGSATGDRNLDAIRSGIDAVFQQFFDDGRRTFDHLAGGDLVDQIRRQLANGR